MAGFVEEMESERLCFRGIGIGDAAQIVAWRASPAVYRYFRSPHQITVEEHTAWYFNSYLRNEKRCDWMAAEKATGKKVGVFGAVWDGEEAEINYILAPESQHKGYAREAVSRIIRYLREKRGIKRFVAEIHRNNLPSIALAESLGFEPLSREGDFLIYRIEG